MDYMQQSFNGGELSPQVLGQLDFTKYSTGLKKCVNWVCLPHGPLQVRSGTEFIAEVKDSSKSVRLIPFIASMTAAYVIEMGDEYARFYTDGARIETQELIRNGNMEENAYWDDHGVPVSSEQSTTQTYNGDYSWKFVTNAAGQGVYQRVLNISVSAAEVLTFSLRVHPSVTSIELRCTGYNTVDGTFDIHAATSHAVLATQWQEITFQETVPNDCDYIDLFIRSSAAAGTGTFYIDAVSVKRDEICEIATDYTEDDIDDLDYAQSIDEIYFAHGDFFPKEMVRYAEDAWFYNEIDFTDYPDAWTAGAGYPESVTFHADRRVWTRDETIYASQVSVYDDHSVNDPVEDSDGLELRLGDGQLSQILFVRSLRGLTLLTSSAEWMATGSDSSTIITANSKKADIGSRSGSDRVRPLLIDNSMIHVLRHKKAIKEIIYDFASDKFVGGELTILAEHLLRNHSIVEMAFQRAPYKIIWAVRSDGTLLGLTYFPEHKVYGWHKHEIGGNGLVKSICVIPGDGEDELWMVVERTIDGSTVKYVERMKPFFVKPDHGQDYYMDEDTTEAVIMDSAVTTDNRINISSITSADPAVITTASNHGWSNGDTIRIRNVLGMLDDDGESGVNLFDFTVANKTDDTAELQYEGSDFDSTVLTAYISGGTAAKKVTAITGLDHLEGEEVTILGDGQQITSETVSGGGITLDDAASVVHVGLGFNADFETLTPRMQTEELGYMSAYEKQIKAVMIRLYESTGLSFGPDEDHLDDFEWTDESVPAGRPPRLFDGDKGEVSFGGSYQKSPTVYIRQSYPLPATVTAIMMDIEVR